MTHLYQEIEATGDEIVRALLSLDPSRAICILDSCGNRPPDGRFLICGFNPAEIIHAFPGFSITKYKDGTAVRTDGDSFLDLLAERTAGVAEALELPVYGAFIASLNYELGYQFDRFNLSSGCVPASGPLARFGYFPSLIIHDYETGRSYVTETRGEAALVFSVDGFLDVLGEYRRRPRLNLQRSEFYNVFAVSNFSRDEYISAVERVKDHIAAGDIYQVNLTQQFTVTLDPDVSAGDIFLELRRQHPASFAAFIRLDDSAIISASPERFLRVNDDHAKRTIEAWPIKGTRRRGKDFAEDQKMQTDLLQSEKDRAENVMIVDLVRNDLGRICRFGTVNVPELLSLQQHPTLFHLVSKVTGELSDDVGAGDILRATFPSGSITGAPKIRAMEIISEIESTPRSVSMGAIGYFGIDGRMDLNVSIRTISVVAGVARFHTGGGIVADSVPGVEYEESLLKAKALFRAMKCRGINPRVSGVTPGSV